MVRRSPSGGIVGPVAGTAVGGMKHVGSSGRLVGAPVASGPPLAAGRRVSTPCQSVGAMRLSTCSKEETQISQIFMLIDADQDGGVSRLEFVNAVFRDPTVAAFVLPRGDSSPLDELSFDEAHEAFDAISDGKRRVGLQDFVLHFRNRAREARQETPGGVACEAQRMFDAIDVDRSGAISKLEFVKALASKPELERFLLSGVGASGSQLLNNENSFDTANILFKSIASGRRNIDFLSFQRYCRKLRAEAARSPLPSPADRTSRCVFAIGAGLRCGGNLRLCRMLEAAGFRVHWCESAPAPEGPGWSPMPYLGLLGAEIADVKPDVLLCASSGGIYVLPLWQAGLWDGPTVFINAHPHLNCLPVGLPVVIAHGSNDKVFPSSRAYLEELSEAGGNSCYLHFTGNSGRLPSGHLSRLGDGHEMESLLQYDCLPRLVDAALCPEGPETSVLRSWRSQLSDDRSRAEQWLGLTTHSFRQRWAPPLPNGARRLLADVAPGSEEFRCVEAVFKANPHDPPAYMFNNATHEQWVARRVLRVQRVENMFQEAGARPYFASLQQSLEEQGLAFEPGTHTRWAFHGASRAAVESILTDPVAGFQPLASGTRGASLWGPGTYFARDGRYVCDGGFCAPAPDGSRQTLLCLLATGMPCLGDPQHIGVLPFRQRPHRYNSSVDSLSSPEVFIIQHAAAALPGYLVTFV